MLKRFFHDTNVNRIYVHGTLRSVVEKINIMFGPIYLLQHGYSVVQALLVLAIIFALRIPTREVYVRFYKQLGLKGGIVLGLFFYAISLLFLPLATHPLFLGLYLLLYAAGISLYWTAFHSFFGMLSQKEHRGKHVSMLACCSMLATATIPFISGWIISTLGYAWLVALTIVLLVLTILPMLGIPYEKEKLMPFRETWKDPANRWGAKQCFFNAMYDANANYIWPIVVFLMMGNVMGFGKVTTGGLLLLAVLQLVVGVAIDRGKGYALFRAGLGLYLLQFLMRAFVVTTPMGVVLSEGLTLGKLLMTQGDTDFYHMGKTARNHFWYFYYTQVGYDLGAVTLLLGAALLYSLHVPLPVVMPIMALPGLIGVGTIILRTKIGK